MARADESRKRGPQLVILVIARTLVPPIQSRVSLFSCNPLSKEQTIRRVQPEQRVKICPLVIIKNENT